MLIDADSVTVKTTSPLQQRLLQLLNENESGVKEYDLLQIIKEEKFIPSENDSGSLTLDLYQQHFILFHNLYLLRDQLLQNEIADIDISPLCIKLVYFMSSDKHLANVDTLREYYLDLSNLQESSEESVNELLNRFWEMYLRNDKRADALAVLGLCDPVDDAEILATYRRLVMENHPDRGGEHELIQKINQAYTNLAKS